DPAHADSSSALFPFPRLVVGGARAAEKEPAQMKQVSAFTLGGIARCCLRFLSFFTWGTRMNHRTVVLAGLAMLAIAALPGTSTAGPAPALYYLQIKVVHSPQGALTYPNGETIADNQYSTAADHGGAWIQFITVEKGYGTGFATFNGIRAT